MRYLENRIPGKRLSSLGMGTARFGTLADEDLSYALMDRFFAGGGTLLDTARNYYEWVENGRGKSEACVGKWMEARKNREEIVLSTKGGVRNEGRTWFYDLSYPALSQEIMESMEALRTEYLDIYLLHRDEPERPVEEIVETMQRVREKGRVRVLGVANWRTERIKVANRYANAHGMEPFRFIQTWWSLAEYTDAMWNDATTTHMTEELYAYMRENDFVGMAYTSQCKGYFQEAARLGVDAVSDALRARIETKANRAKAQYIQRFSEREGISPTAFVTGYITSNPLPGVALFSTMNMAHLEELLSSSDYVLDEKEIAAIDCCEG